MIKWHLATWWDAAYVKHVTKCTCGKNRNHEAKDKRR
jgi:hypothetical protein